MKTLKKITHRISSELINIQATLNNKSGNETLEKIAWALGAVIVVGIVFALFKENIGSLFNTVFEKIEAALDFSS